MQIGSYAVLFPWDAHVPAVQSEEAMVIRKVVLKIRMDMLQKNLKLAF
ncbi:YhcH/YjgK/YiaL family protein [Eggerthella sinensis]|nr:YhcH/YjgK/YiaL family protein [Eggerthella sinensis]